jgi:hypothetical protein
MTPWFSSVCKFSFLLTTLFVGVLAQDGGLFAALDIDFGTPTARVWGRYVVSDKTTVRVGWINPQDGELTYAITRLSANDTSQVRGIVYSPGCALQTFDIAIQEPRSYRYSFPCEPISQIEIHGSIPQLGRLYDGDVRIEAKYVADWAPDFFKYDDGTTTEIPLGGAGTLDDQNHFHLPIPDLSRDKLAGSPTRGGEIRIFIRNQKSGQIIDLWKFTPQDSKLRATRFGGIPIGFIKPDSGLFTFCPARSVFAHDQFGFALRPEIDPACSP